MKKRFHLVAGTVIAGATLSSGALAQSVESCDSILSSYESYLQSQPEYAEAYRLEYPACFGSSSSATQQINATSFTQASAISRAIGQRNRTSSGPTPLAAAGVTGLSAGSAPLNWNVWGTLSQSDVDVGYNTFNTGLATNQKIRGNSDTQNSVIGADYPLNAATVVGLSLALDRGKSWSENLTAANGKVKSSTDGFTLAPYVAYQINANYSLDASAGWGAADFDTSTTKADVDRWFAAANLNYERWVDKLQFTGKLSFLHGEEDMSDIKTKATGAKTAGTGTLSKVDQLRLGGQVGYWMNGVMPYAALAYTSNIHRATDGAKDPLGRDAFVATVGVNFYSLSSKISGGIAWEEELNRTHSDNRLLTANLNIRF